MNHFPLICHVCRQDLDPAARNLNVDGGWVMVPTSRSKVYKRDRVAAHLCHAGIKEEVIRCSAFPDLERALDAWNNREVEEALLAAELEYAP